MDELQFDKGGASSLVQLSCGISTALWRLAMGYGAVAFLTPTLLKAYIDAGVDEDSAQLCVGRVRTLYTAADRWSLLPGVEEALVGLKEAGFVHVVVSNHVPELPALVEALQLDHYVDEVFNSASIGWEKPHPKIFKIVKAALKPLEVSSFVGDSQRADIDGAAAAS